MYTIKIDTKSYNTFSLHKCEIYRDMIRQDGVQSLETPGESIQDLSGMVSMILLQLKLILNKNGDDPKYCEILLETNNNNILKIFKNGLVSNKEIKKFAQYCRKLAKELNLKVSYSTQEFPEYLNKFNTILWCTNDIENNTSNIILKITNKSVDGLHQVISKEFTNDLDNAFCIVENAIELGMRYKGLYFKPNQLSILLTDNVHIINALENPDKQILNVISEERIKDVLYRLKILNCSIGLIPSSLNLASGVVISA